MAVASLSVRGEDFGLGYVGPVGNMQWAAFGAASKAPDAKDQKVIVVSSPADAEELLGTGPLRDLLVTALTGTGGSIPVFPLKRFDEGGVLGSGTAKLSGTMSVTVANTVYGYGQQAVTVRCVTGGAIAAAEFELIINGRRYPKWSPTASTSHFVPDASAGPLNDGVATSGKLSVAIALNSATAFKVGDEVSFQYAEPSIAVGDIARAVNALAEHGINWRFIIPGGWFTDSAWATFDAAVRLLPNQGKYVRGLVQLRGNTELTGADADITAAAWHSNIINTYAGDAPVGAPPRVGNPRTGAVSTWMRIEDPIQGVERRLPFTYALAALMAARQPWEPPEATKHGPMITDPQTRVKLLDVLDIEPPDMTKPQRDAQDDIWVTTATRYPGKVGIYATHVRLFGRYPQAGVTGSDFIGIERGFVMDEACTRVYDELFDTLNSDIDTGPDGRMTPAARGQIQGLVNGAIATMLQDRAIARGEATVIGKIPGILQTSTVLVRLRIVPRGKIERIEATVGFSPGIVVSEEVAAEAA